MTPHSDTLQTPDIDALFQSDRDHRKTSRKDWNNYGVGLDLGTGSAGWAAITPDYRLLRLKGHDAIGARLFDTASNAAERRSHRTMRRRLSRRKWRLHFVDELFAEEINKKDPNFFQRRRYSWVHAQDEQNRNHYFGGYVFPTSHEDKKLHRDYPTMYHLRYALMGQGDHAIKGKVDIRLVYLAIHSMIKYRGNFLRSGDIRPDNLCTPALTRNLLSRVFALHSEMSQSEWANLLSDETCKNINTALTATIGSPTERADNAVQQIHDLLEAQSTFDKSTKKNIEAVAKPTFRILEGNKADLTKILNLSISDDEQKKQFSLTFKNEDIDITLEGIHNSGYLDEDTDLLLDKLFDEYSAVALSQMLGDSKFLSQAMINRYNTHRERLQKLLSYCSSKEEQHQFRSEYKKLLHPKDKNDAPEATKYFKSFLDKNHLGEPYTTALDNGDLFPLQRGSQNGFIPHQLHLNELRLIIQNQGKYYPFLNTTFSCNGQEVNELECLLTFKIPYYVGPLVTKDQTERNHDNAENHWMIRREGHENTRITPWNYSDVVDTDTTAREFINRLTDTDTYLLGEPTLPSRSPIYQLYEVLNELNNTRVDDGIQRHRHLEPDEKDELLRGFKRYKTMTVKRAESILHSIDGKVVKLSGLSDSKRYVSSLSSFIDFSTIFGDAFVDDRRNSSLLENIAEIQTVFEDTPMRRRQICLALQNAGISLPSEKIDKLNRHYTGWGRISSKLLTTKVGRLPRRDGAFSILEVLEYTDKNFMQIVHDQRMGFGEWIAEQNRHVATEYKSPTDRMQAVLDETRMSSQARRGVIQAFKVLEDLRRATGHAPRRVFIEMADDPQPSKKTQSRLTQLKKLYDINFNQVSVQEKKQLTYLKDQLKHVKNTSELQKGNKLFLYFLQQGKDLYSGEPLDIDQLDRYDIDHIIPQAVTKDDSIENLALILKQTNARKTNSLHFDANPAVFTWWKMLAQRGFIGQKKLHSLERMTSQLTDYDRQRFTARALVSTRQILTNVKAVIQAAYPHTEVICVNSELTKEMRQFLGFAHKNRDINDYHHAQDALAMASAAQFAYNRGFFRGGDVHVRRILKNDPDTAAVNAFNRYLQDYLKRMKTEASEKNQERLRPFGFVVGSLRSADPELRRNADGVLVWSESDKKYLRHVMSYKKMLVTKRGGDEPGALWNATIMPAHASSNARIALSKNKQNTNLYGYYKGQNAARIQLTYQNGKYKLENVSVKEWSDHHSGKSFSHTTLLDFLPGQLILLKRKNVKGQVVYMPVRAKAASEFNNAREFWLPEHFYNLADTVLKNSDEKTACRIYLGKKPNEEITEAEITAFEQKLNELFTYLCDQLISYYPLYSFNQQKYDAACNKFPLLPYSDAAFASTDKGDSKRQTKANILRNVILDAFKAGPSARLPLGVSGKTGSANIIQFGSDFGRMHSKQISVLQPDDVFVFESPTGLFSTRITVEQLREQKKKSTKIND
jgi:CRISPR-associated endonuclease Csn1